MALLLCGSFGGTMTDERLAEIVTRTQQDERRLAKAIFGYLDIEGARLDINDKRWLLARVHELTARNEALEGVVEAARHFGEYDDDGNEREWRVVQKDRWDDLERALAALDAKPDIRRLHIPEGKASAGTAEPHW